MLQTLLFLAFTGIAILALIAVSHFKRVDFSSTVGIFLFGMLISIPFIMVEYMAWHLKYYIVILAFIAIEFGILYAKRKVKYFHDLIHHNIKRLRIVSFVLIGLGFTYSEISFAIFNSHGSPLELMSTLPFKTVYSLLIHTVLASAASLIRLGNLFAETIFETIFKLVSYYLRITIISVSHFLYVFSVEHNFMLLISLVLGISIIAFFHFKKNLDLKHLTFSRERT